MKDPSAISLIEQKIKLYFSENGEVRFSQVGGGCINECYRLTFNKHQLFCKANSATKFPQLLLKEADGLRRIHSSHSIITPGIVDYFEAGEQQILLLEWIREGERTERFWLAFGEQLAALHHVSDHHFGLDTPNYMGSVTQLNHPHSDWCNFFINERLLPLVNDCLKKNLLNTRHADQFEKINKRLPGLFEKNIRLPWFTGISGAGISCVIINLSPC